MLRALGRGFAGTAWLAAGLHLSAGDSNPLLIAFHATAGLWWLAGVGFLGISLLARDPVGAIANGMALAVAVAWTVPGTLGGSSSVEGTHLRVGVANVLSSNPEAFAAVADLASEEPHVMAVLEVSPRIEPDVRALSATWPVLDVLPRTDNFGIALLGPTGSTASQVSVAGIPWMALELPGGVEVLAAHTLPPMVPAYREVWLEQLDWLVARNADGRPRIVLADLNLTRHNPTFGRLTRAGYADALAAAGQGGARTWTPIRAGPDLVRLDHVLVSGGIGVEGVRVLPRRGSDHRAVVADLTVP